MSVAVPEFNAIQFEPGVLFFPVTPFAADGSVNLDLFAEHLRRGLASAPGGVFAACGTGEFYSLSVEEHAIIVATAVAVVGHQVPVLAGAGGPLPVAQAHARSAAEAGADGILLMPPYLAGAPADGTFDYVRAVAKATDLPVIVYHRPGLCLTPELAVAIAGLPTVVGVKDGLGDIDLIQRIVLAVRACREPAGKQFQFFNGLPTAEMTAAAYRSMGIAIYSSAVFCFAPEIANAFNHALRCDDEAETQRLLRDFYGPFSRLRVTTPGYAVSLIKAAVRLRGMDVGGVRAPLIDPRPDHLEILQALLAAMLPDLKDTSREHDLAGGAR